MGLLRNERVRITVRVCSKSVKSERIMFGSFALIFVCFQFPRNKKVEYKFAYNCRVNSLVLFSFLWLSHSLALTNSNDYTKNHFVTALPSRDDDRVKRALWSLGSFERRRFCCRARASGLSAVFLAAHSLPYSSFVVVDNNRGAPDRCSHHQSVRHSTEGVAPESPSWRAAHRFSLTGSHYAYLFTSYPS